MTEKTINTYDNSDKLRLSILCGMPFSGKTKYTEYIQDSGIIILRARDARQHCGGSATESWSMLLFTAYEILSQGHSVMIDATNYNRKARKTWARLAHKTNAVFEVIYFPILPGEVRRRSQECSDVIDATGLERAINFFVPPMVKECDVMYTIKKECGNYEATVESNTARGFNSAGRVRF